MSGQGARSVPRWARRFWYCFGGLAFFSAILMALSGVFLAFYYQPTPDRAYESVFYISNYVRYGWLIRSVHAWGSRIMLVLVVLHMLRVFVMAAYKHPRELNWIAGVLLLVVTLAFAVTGALLPWDERGFASATAIVELLARVPVVGDAVSRLVAGSANLGAAALTRFYASHVIVLPALLLVGLAAHFRMVRKHGVARPL